MHVTFGDVSFDDGARQVCRGAREIHLTRKAFDLLAFLLGRRPNAVPKEVIHAHLWPGTFVSEANLQSLISEIRDAIGDNARKPRFIRTVHGVGYAFIGTPVEDARLASENPARGVRAWLIGEMGRVPLLEGEVVLGRGADDVIEFDSPTVSRRHARILVGEQITLEDLGSKNGTFVRDRSVKQPVRLSDGDRIRIGSFLLTFRARSSARQTKTASTEPSRRQHRPK